MESTTCPLCGRPAARGRRYCEECGGAGQLEGPGDSPTTSTRPAVGTTAGPEGRGELRLFFGVFLFVGLTTTLLGMAAPAALNHPVIRKTLHLEPLTETASEWGEMRWVHTGTRIREGRSTRTPTVAFLQPGDSVRADFDADGWYAVFAPTEEIRDPSRALGYVYAPLLNPQPPDGSLARR